MNYWNYRVIRTSFNIGESSPFFEYHIHEVYYDGNDKPTSWTKDPIGPSGDTLEGLEWDVKSLQEAFTKPVLEIQGNKLVEVEAPLRIKEKLCQQAES